jgi:putative transposase
MTDSEWEIYRLFFPELIGIPGVAEPKTTTREVLNAIRYIVRTGCQWINLPHDFPPTKTVGSHFYRWRKQGLFQKHREHEAIAARVAEGRSTTPTACAIDSQSVKTTEMAKPEERGFDAGKKVKGRKRHILVDVLGILLAVLITPADVQDRDGGAALMRMAAVMYPTIRLAWVDSAYNGDVIAKASKDTGIAIEMKTKPEGEPGFVPIKKRWVVERTFGWMNRYRRLSKDYERTIESSQAWIDIAIGQLLSRRLHGPIVRFRH